MTDTTTNATFSTSRAFDLAGLTGGSAYLGFTGGRGFYSSTQQFSALDFTPTAEPGSLGLLGLGVMGLLRRRGRTLRTG